MDEAEHAVPQRIAQVILNSLQSGAVSRVGLLYIAIGRKKEIVVLLRDTEPIAEGDASFRLLIGKYGTDESFLLQAIRNYTFEQGLAVVDTDLSSGRCLQDNKGQGLATYRELTANPVTKTKPEGGMLCLILDRWVSQAKRETTKKQDGFREGSIFFSLVEKKIVAAVDALQDMVHGSEFAKLLRGYHLAGAGGDGERKKRILKWFHGEYENKRETRGALGINLIMGDKDWYGYLELFSQFFRRAGYAGTLILLDEAVDLCKTPNAITRQHNYGVLLTMHDDMIQDKAQHIDVWMGATSEAFEDKRRGLFSYEVFSSRLAKNRFSRVGSRDLFSSVLRLEALTLEEMLVLTEKLSAMHATFYGDARCFRTGELELSVQIHYAQVRASAQLTPREMMRDFIFLLDALHRGSESNIEQLLKPEAGGTALESITNELGETGGGDNASSSFSF